MPSAPDHAPQDRNTTGDPVFNGIWTLCGTPSLTLPLFQAENGMPIGMQLVAPRGADAHYCVSPSGSGSNRVDYLAGSTSDVLLSSVSFGLLKTCRSEATSILIRNHQCGYEIILNCHEAK